MEIPRSYNQTLQSRMPKEMEKADATQSSRVESENCIGTQIMQM